MTAENHGTGAASEGGDEDPFAYLYRQEGGTQQPPAGGQQPGVPRRSFNQVRTVGERQYGYGYPQQQRSGYGYPQQGAGQQQSGYGYPPQQQSPPPPGHQPSPHYAAPETMPGGRAATRQQGGPGPGGNGRGGRNRTGLLVGAIAVVAAVVIGIGAAIVFNKDDSDKPQDKEPTSQPDDHKQESGGDQDDEQDEKPAPKALPKEDAASLTLGGSAGVAKDVPGAQGRGGSYVGGLNQPGASVTWDLKDLPAAGKYTLHVRYGVPGKDSDATVTVNGKPETRPVRMKNFAHAKKGDWEHGWTSTWSNIQLKKGQNSVKISCEEGNKCDANLDQVWLEKGWK